MAVAAHAESSESQPATSQGISRCRTYSYSNDAVPLHPTDNQSTEPVHVPALNRVESRPGLVSGYVRACVRVRMRV